MSLVAYPCLSLHSIPSNCVPALPHDFGVPRLLCSFVPCPCAHATLSRMPSVPLHTSSIFQNKALSLQRFLSFHRTSCPLFVPLLYFVPFSCRTDESYLPLLTCFHEFLPPFEYRVEFASSFHFQLLLG